MGEWGYAKCNGPATWSKSFPVAAGKTQSPIDLKKKACSEDGALKPIKVDYSTVEVGEISNTGSSWKAQVTGGKSTLTGGPLNSTFVLEQFHAHWGSNDKLGSEHTVDGQMFSAELHLVHWDSVNFKSFGEAAAAKGGLAVLGIFLKVNKKAQSELEKLTKLLPFIQYKNQCVNVSEKIDCSKFLPENTSYFTYDGSLTTPPCYESVNWIVFEEPVEISTTQMSIFRSMKSYPRAGACPVDELAGKMVDNFRPCCPTNDRQVRVFKC